MSGRLLNDFVGGACPVPRDRLKISCSGVGSGSVHPQQRHTPRERQHRKSGMPKEEDADSPGGNQAAKGDGGARPCVHNGSFRPEVTCAVSGRSTREDGIEATGYHSHPRSPPGK